MSQPPTVEPPKYRVVWLTRLMFLGITAAWLSVLYLALLWLTALNEDWALFEVLIAVPYKSIIALTLLAYFAIGWFRRWRFNRLKRFTLG